MYKNNYELKKKFSVVSFQFAEIYYANKQIHKLILTVNIF
jgi:hypothetical protein